jgi:hypothetical protein
MGMGQQHLDGLGIEAVAEVLKRLSLLPAGHPWIDHGQPAISMFHDVGLLAKGVARESMHHGA